ncbi:class I SAM-dependent methyltransferase [Streptomyces sp. NPDC020917]|uniref:class I SAM-dependent methyltransferase n=1 Tax=Streptomyces sp. NPDC020917 TaxID=3365102 RepID=UPI0037AB8092
MAETTDSQTTGTEATEAELPRLLPEIAAYYAAGNEDARLRTGEGRLEFWRTQDVLRRLLPGPPARILDVGGGSGVHAQWLAQAGHAVELVDPVPLHVEQAGRLSGVTARLGDARALDAPDASADAVLLLGPLYHLIERADRVRALAEARRVVRPGGPVIAATINRFAGMNDTLRRALYFDPERQQAADAILRDGLQHIHHPKREFTTAYFHQPPEVPAEFLDAGLAPFGQYGVEGTAWLMDGIHTWLDDPDQREAVLHAMRLAESDPSLLGVSGHLLTAGRRPQDS